MDTLFYINFNIYFEFSWIAISFAFVCKRKVNWTTIKNYNKYIFI